MDKSTFIEKIKEIGTCEDDVNRRGLLTALSEDIEKVFDDLTESTNTIDGLNKTIEQNNIDMEDLRKANMDLFKRIGSNTPGKVEQEIPGIEPEKEKLKFEDLFKGGDN